MENKKELEQMMDILGTAFRKIDITQTREIARCKIKIYDRYEKYQKEYYLRYHEFYRDISEKASI